MKTRVMLDDWLISAALVRLQHDIKSAILHALTILTGDSDWLSGCLYCL